MYSFSHAYPTPQHADAADAITALFSRQPGVEAVLLMGSCARGKASPSSCLDVLVLCRPETIQHSGPHLEQVWQEALTGDPVYQKMLQHGPFAQAEVSIIDGNFDPARHYHGWTSGADEFELEVGNILAYTVPLWECGSYYQDLRSHWLPYYDEELRRSRLAMVLKYCRNNLQHIPLYAPRGLYFQSFKRFYHAFEEFLQALFISRRVYPIAYDKWVKEGVVDILGLPDLYARLPHLLEIRQFESLEIVQKAEELDGLIAEWVEEPSRMDNE
jgi:predicted nucleotidyltransferase